MKEPLHCVTYIRPSNVYLVNIIKKAQTLEVKVMDDWWVGHMTLKDIDKTSEADGDQSSVFDEFWNNGRYNEIS